MSSIRSTIYPRIFYVISPAILQENQRDVSIVTKLDKVTSLLGISCSYGARVDQEPCQLSIESPKATDQVATKQCLELKEPMQFQYEQLGVDLHLLLSVILASSAMTSSFSKASLPARTSRPSEE